jgi:branched-chain amino acid transport system permease protein
MSAVVPYESAAAGRVSRPSIRAALAGALLLGALLLPMWRQGAVVDVVALALLYGYLAASWNVIGGLAGQFSLGHAAFFGMGAYGVGICYAQLHLSPYIGIIAGVGVATAAALLLGLLSFWLPFAGYTFILLTLSFSEFLRALLRASESFGGSDGLIFPFHPGIATLQFRNTTVYYYIVLAMVVLVIFLTKLLRNSAFGMRAEAVRDDEGAAVALGIAATRTKLGALLISAALTSLGGAVYAVMYSFITPDHVFSVDFSVAMVAGALIGGIGTAWGPVVGGTLMWLLTEALARLPLGSGVGANLAVMMYGLALIIIVQRLPAGAVTTLVGEQTRGHLSGRNSLSRLINYFMRRPAALDPEPAAPRNRIHALSQDALGLAPSSRPEREP